MFRPDVDDLYMFYLSQFMRDCVYFVPAFNAYVIAEADGSVLHISDILSPGPVSLRDICAAFGSDFNRFIFAFRPSDVSGLGSFNYIEEDTTFFVQGEPLLSDLALIGSFTPITHA